MLRYFICYASLAVSDEEDDKWVFDSLSLRVFGCGLLEDCFRPGGNVWVGPDMKWVESEPPWVKIYSLTIYINRQTDNQGNPMILKILDATILRLNQMSAIYLKKSNKRINFFFSFSTLEPLWTLESPDSSSEESLSRPLSLKPHRSSKNSQSHEACCPSVEDSLASKALHSS